MYTLMATRKRKGIAEGGPPGDLIVQSRSSIHFSSTTQKSIRSSGPQHATLLIPSIPLNYTTSLIFETYVPLNTIPNLSSKEKASEQLWWFVSESTEESKYDQKSKLLSEVQAKSPRFSDILALLSLRGKPEEYGFWIHSPSMNAAVRLLKDEAINVMWRLYCQNDPTVTIIVRPASDPSPNTSEAPSGKSSLAERRKASGKRTISGIFIRPPVQHVSQHLDPLTHEPLKDLAETGKIVIDFGSGKYETFSKDYLLGWIESEASNGRSITEITVRALTKNKRPIHFQLSKDVWMSSLLRGPHRMEFQEIWDREQKVEAKRSSALEGLFRKPNFTQNVMAFIRDLHHYGRNAEAQRRLNSTGHEFYLGPPYFTPDVVNQMLSLPLGSGTLLSSLRDIVRRKTERNEGDEICAAHDLAPVFESAVQIYWKDLKSKPNVLRGVQNFPDESKGGKGKSHVGTVTKGLMKKASFWKKRHEGGEKCLVPPIPVTYSKGNYW